MRLTEFDWVRIAALLHATVSTKLRGWPEAIALNWPERQFVMHENGGEYNVTCREADGSAWELDFSIPYTRWGVAIGPATFAYSVRCAIESKQIDYEVDLDDWITSPGLAHVARVVILNEIVAYLERRGAAGLRRARFEAEHLFQIESPSRIKFADMLRRLELPGEEVEKGVRRVLQRAMPAQQCELDQAVQAAQDIPGGHHKRMACECTSRRRGRVCILCQFKRGPLPKNAG